MSIWGEVCVLVLLCTGTTGLLEGGVLDFVGGGEFLVVFPRGAPTPKKKECKLTGSCSVPIWESEPCVLTVIGSCCVQVLPRHSWGYSGV